MTSLSFSTFSAWVSIDGEKARVYGVDSSEADRVTGWIASEVDKPFEISWKDSLVEFPTRGRIYIDGEFSGGKSLCRKQDANKPTQRWGMRISATEQRPYTFAHLATTDDDSVSNTLPQSIGQIELEISQATIENIKAQPRSYRDLPPEMVFNERDKKSYDHHVKFGSPVKSRASSFMDKKWTGIGQPIVTFCFKYRPLAILQAEGIAPLPPQAPKHFPQVPKQEGRAANTIASRSITLQEDDVEALENRALALQAESNDIKARLEAIKKRKRRSGDVKVEDQANSKRVKREYTTVPGEIEVIDLT
ncbi:hypothetical protein BDZ89DRAFT_1008833 [Hymenopellis radicata]|nr:hypothetical protein BDZ89DRAFT_1008833 [Hymenopellis radicata]